MKGLVLNILTKMAAKGILGLDLDLGNIPCAEDGSCDMSGGSFVSNIVNWVYMGLGIVAVLVIIVAGIQFLISQGEPEKTKKAQSTIIYTVWGLVIATAAALIVNFVLGALS